MKVELIITRKVLTEKFSIKSDMEGFFLSFLDGCELKVSDMYPGNIFYIKDGFIFFQQGTATKSFYVRYKMIWFVFEKEYQMAHKEIQEFIKSIIYNYINLNNYMPYIGWKGLDESLTESNSTLEKEFQNCRLKEYTPCAKLAQSEWEEYNYLGLHTLIEKDFPENIVFDI